tara:strand:- start:27161 stop:27565 length:405 start_codon:yes stop_codon:yes gene_type:complete
MPITFKDKMPKKDPNQGIHTYEGSEIANIGIGQTGWDVIGVAGKYVNEDEAVASNCLGGHTRGWVALKVIGNNVTIQAESNVGDHLTNDGSAPNFNTSGGNGVTILNSDTIYGNFKKVFVEAVLTGGIVLAYRG